MPVSNFINFADADTLIQLNNGYIDIHCHRKTIGKHIDILSVDIHEYSPDMVNRHWITLGLHPWYIGRQDVHAALLELEKNAEHPQVLGIGECGLDKAINRPLPEQLAVFSQQMQLAARLNKPIIIHCVRAFSELMQIKKRSHAPEYWIIHGFNAKPVVAQQLLKLGFYFSFGKALLQTNSNANQVLSILPLNRFFLETDASDVDISQIYAAAGYRLDMDVSSLQNQLAENFRNVFMP
ncbi:TatD family hydrolase [Methylomonas sp. AM2-LC]|uniref:TatD family hydrolase n=1 Tax=Methylomonas sp. AM2-LC TaxID=3153301 RepID=UPI003267EAB8